MGRNQDVDAWLERYDNPVGRIRDIVLAADPRIVETHPRATSAELTCP